MRLKIFAAFTIAMSVSFLAGTSSAQVAVEPSQNIQSAQLQQQPQGAPPPGQRPMGPVFVAGGGTMGPQMRGPMGGAGAVRNQGAGAFGPIHSVFKLLAALDDQRVRTMLGITDQQSDSLHKLVLDTETFTITTGAAAAVDALELRELLRADKPDRAAVMSKGNEFSKSTSDLISHYLDAILTAKQIFTPEQQKMIQNYMENGAPPPPPPPAVAVPPARR
jgi:Spy/CpxP family protein refolding chaperone